MWLVGEELLIQKADNLERVDRPYWKRYGIAAALDHAHEVVGVLKVYMERFVVCATVAIELHAGDHVLEQG